MAVSRPVVCLFVLVAAVGWPAVTRGQTALSGDAIHMTRARGPITVDGSLSDEGWLNATRIDKWYETNPGDNVEPKVKSVGYLTYDDKLMFVGYGDERELSDANRLEPLDRQFFVKLSYAFQR